jgi:carboxypeptidase Taq
VPELATEVRSTAWTGFADWMARVNDIRGAAALLHWDRETAMPAAGAAGRAHQLATLAAIHHRELIRADVDDLIGELEDAGLDEHRVAMVREARRERGRATRLPEELVRAVSEACSRCVDVWHDARPRNDFAAYADALAPLIELKREEAAALGDGGEPYDALLDEFEPGARAADLEPIFAELRERLAPLVAQAHEREPYALPARRWPAAGQLAIAQEIARAVGFDERAGLIAESAHPFTNGNHRGDVRFTTRVEEDEPIGNLTAVLHEAGHALYEQGLPAAYERTTLYDAPSLGAHESQSRFWENHVGRTLAFWEWVAPAMRRHFPEAMEGIAPADLHRAATQVRPSPVRVAADEVTYNLHIVLRFELDLALMRGDLAVHDLQGAWNEALQRLLGLRPPSDADGVMQDIHWADGLIGYFPTYTLGNLYAAQLTEAFVERHGDLEPYVARGEFGPLLDFMRDRVHRHGRRLGTRELMRAATGRELGVDAFIAHLTAAYG